MSTKEREERKRKLLIKRKFLADKRKLDKFLSDKTSLNDYFKQKIFEYSELEAVTDTYNGIHYFYKELEKDISQLSSIIQSNGIKKGDFVSIFSENNGRWIVMEQAVLRCGAVCTLRGSGAPVEELDFILRHSESKALIIENIKTLNKLLPYLKITI